MRYANNRANIVTRPYTVTLTYGETEHDHHAMLDPLHVGDALAVPHGVFEMGFRVHEGWPLNHSVAFNHIVAQWRQMDKPTHALTIDGGRWMYRGVMGQRDLGEVTPDRTDFVFNFLWRDTDYGRLEIVRDGETVLDERGTTIDSEKRERMHWTVGIYRPWWNLNGPVEGEPTYRTLDVWL